MTTFLVLDDEQAEMLGFGLNTALRVQRQLMGEIMRERMQRAEGGDASPADWKQTRFNTLLHRVHRLEALVRMLDGTPDTVDPPPPEEPA